MTAAPYAVVIGEALIDLLEGLCEGEPVYRPSVGGAPLNVAVGVARLGGAVQFAGSIGNDELAERVRAALVEAGVGIRSVVSRPVPTALAMTTLRGIEPDFRFYGEPPSYGLFGPEDLDLDLVAGARVLSCGSIGLGCPPLRRAAEAAWSTPGPVRVFDPNIRPHFRVDPAVVERFVATADLVKLSEADAQGLYGIAPERAAARLAGLGAGAVVVTLGGAGALVVHNGQSWTVPPAAVRPVDTTGAGDATMAGLVWGILTGGLPSTVDGWAELTGFAVRVAGLVCESRGAARAMPTLAQVRARFGG